MSQPVKLSDALVLEARIAAEAQERSIAGQVEFWAKLGRCVGELLDGRAQQRLANSSKRPSLSELVDSIEKPEGQARLKNYLEREPFPHFEAHPTRKGLLIRIESNGRRTVGKFKNRQFVAIPESKPGNQATRGAKRAASGDAAKSDSKAGSKNARRSTGRRATMARVG